MLYDTPGEKFLDDPEYVADAIVAASSALPCPSCLTGLMQVKHENFGVRYSLDLDGRYDAFVCQSCKRRVLVERRAS